MNIYVFPKQDSDNVANAEVPNSNELKAIALAMFYGTEFDVNLHEIVMEVPFSLSNVKTDKIVQVAATSGANNTIEDFDKPIVEAGDIVVAMVLSTEAGTVTQYFDDYRKINGVARLEDEANDGQYFVHDVYIGLSNSSKSDFHTPFQGITHFAFSPSKLAKVGRSNGFFVKAPRALQDVANVMNVAKGAPINQLAPDMHTYLDSNGQVTIAPSTQGRPVQPAVLNSKPAFSTTHNLR